MLILYETAMGYCLFKMSDSAADMGESQLRDQFESPEKANKLYADSFLNLNFTRLL